MKRAQIPCFGMNARGAVSLPTAILTIDFVGLALSATLKIGTRFSEVVIKDREITDF